jgi:hypothetical protein
MTEWDGGAVASSLNAVLGAACRMRRLEALPTPDWCRHRREGLSPAVLAPPRVPGARPKSEEAYRCRANDEGVRR